jgi:hypothetical protein
VSQASFHNRIFVYLKLLTTVDFRISARILVPFLSNSFLCSKVIAMLKTDLFFSNLSRISLKVSPRACATLSS